MSDAEKVVRLALGENPHDRAYSNPRGELRRARWSGEELRHMDAEDVAFLVNLLETHSADETAGVPADHGDE